MKRKREMRPPKDTEKVLVDQEIETKDTEKIVVGGVESRWKIRPQMRVTWSKGPEWTGPLFNPDMYVDQRFKHVDIHVFDDFDHCRATKISTSGMTREQKDERMLSIYEECYGWLGKATKRIGYEGTLMFHVAGMEKHFSKSHHYAFRKMGVNFCVVKNGERDSANKWLLVELTKWFKEGRREPKICIILSGNRKAFWDPLEEIYNKADFKCFLAYTNATVKANKYLIGRRAEGLFDWMALRRGDLEPIFWVPKSEFDRVHPPDLKREWSAKSKARAMKRSRAKARKRGRAEAEVGAEAEARVRARKKAKKARAKTRKSAAEARARAEAEAAKAKAESVRVRARKRAESRKMARARKRARVEVEAEVED